NQFDATNSKDKLHVFERGTLLRSGGFYTRRYGAVLGKKRLKRQFVVYREACPDVSEGIKPVATDKNTRFVF
ncbi:MAG: hypothetical protein MUD08_15840, partial [Cytophagales bacterium]|nr:hypothetical protein [Cytophagales bacterium]